MTEVYSTINLALFLFGIGVISGHSAHNTKALKTWTLAVLSLQLWLVIEMLLTYDRRLGGIQFFTDLSWIHPEYWLGFDGLSLIFLFIAYLLLMSCLLISWQQIENTKSYTLTLLLIAGCTTLLVGAHHLILQAVFLGLLLASVYFHLLTQGSHRQNLIHAFGKVALSGYFCIVIGVIILFHQGAVMTHNATGLNQELTLSYTFQMIVSLLLLVGSAYFIPVFPFHNWLFLRLEETSFSEKVILLGILGKVTFLMLLRIIVVFLPATASILIPGLVVWGLIDLIYAALAGTVQTAPNDCSAYWVLSQSGLLLIVLAILVSRNNDPSMYSACGSGALFLLFVLMLTVPLLFAMRVFEVLTVREQISSPAIPQSQPIVTTILFFVCVGLPLSIALIIFGVDLTVLPAWQLITVLIMTGILIGMIALGKHWSRLRYDQKVAGTMTYTQRTALIIIVTGLLIGAIFPALSLKIIEHNIPTQLQITTQSQRSK